MLGIIIFEIRDSDSEDRIESAEIEVLSGSLVAEKVSDGIYFGAGSHEEYTLRVSATDYNGLTSGGEITGRFKEEIIHLTRVSN
jgi:hypothetical protein